MKNANNKNRRHYHAACFMLVILLRLPYLLYGFTSITAVIHDSGRKLHTGIRGCPIAHHDVILLSSSKNNHEPTIVPAERNPQTIIVQQNDDDDLPDRSGIGQQHLQQASISSSSSSPTILIHWKGEGTEGSTLQFRHVEFQGALQAVLLANNHAALVEDDDYSISFANALEYSGEAEMPYHKRIRFNSAMQHLQFHYRHENGNDGISSIPLDLIIQAVQRCSLIHAMYQIIASVPAQEPYAALSDCALQQDGGGLLNSMRRGNAEEHATWCVRVRYYGGDTDDSNNHDTGDSSSSSSSNDLSDSHRAEKRRKREKRHGERTRSLSLERRALQALKPLLLTFGGGVDLQNPDCKLYIMDGLVQRLKKEDHSSDRENEQQQQQQVKILARRMAMGPRVSIMAPATRICITNTPLCPMAAFWMCNIAGIRPGQAILDPFAGSCAILMAAAMIRASCRTVAIEIAHNGLVNRPDIQRDFTTRNLTLPCDLVHGDCTDVRVRRRAKRALLQPRLPNVNDDHGGQHEDDDDSDSSTLPSFDYIITDPPYGIRESTNYNSKTPLQELFQAIAHDRQAAQNTREETPLLKPGGKLVCFVPVSTGEDLFRDVLPSQEEQDRAGLVLQKEIMQEQPLNENLSRWLLCFHSV
jgi:16S rRNA G966 N2-methylase RsmD